MKNITHHGGNVHKLAASCGLEPEGLLDFSASINPLGPPEYFRSVISRNLSNILHYPDPDYSVLVQHICSKYKVAPENVVVGNGTSELIFTLPRLLPVSRCVIPVPAYVDYQRASELVGLSVENIYLSESQGFELDFDILAAALQGNEAVFLGQPNNPTGVAFDKHKLLELAKANPATFFIIDEAFSDFIPGDISLFAAVQNIPANIIILKSLTKFYAIPGLRLGFLRAEPELARKLRASLAPWGVNSLALALGEKMLADQTYAEKSRGIVGELRAGLLDMLRKVNGLRVFKATANYLLVKVVKPGWDAFALQEKLLEKGIAIRVCDNFLGLGANYLRIAVRTEEENIVLYEGLSEICGEKKIVSRKKKTPSLMFQGAGSDAGKSILTTGLCRVLLQDGLQVAPFKSQNMSLNSFVTRDGGEMGRAQVVQAQACRLDPETRMNPILLKPSSDVGSQVIVNGQPVGNMSVEEYVAYKPQAFKAAQEAYDSLAADYDAVILEGAGSPAEVNLKSHDIVNMNMARYAKAPVLLIGDIDRGGIFASFVGTMEVLSEWERRLVAGFIVNRFRGREALLADAFEYTMNHTGRPVFGVIPYLKNLGLPEEDSVGFKKGLFEKKAPEGGHVVIALIDLPHISNFTDFEPFLAEPDVHLLIVRHPEDLKKPDAVILPGSKNVIHDLNFLQSSGLAEAIGNLAEAGKTEVIGICGGFQMLGQRIADPHGIEAAGELDGLALLNMTTVLEKSKILVRQSGTHLDSGMAVHGYEIHHGQTPARETPALRDEKGSESGAVSKNKMIWGTYLHGLFDSDTFRHWFVENLRERQGLAAFSGRRSLYDLEPALDRLADVVRERLDMGKIYQLLGIS